MSMMRRIARRVQAVVADRAQDLPLSEGTMIVHDACRRAGHLPGMKRDVDGTLVPVAMTSKHRYVRVALPDGNSEWIWVRIWGQDPTMGTVDSEVDLATNVAPNDRVRIRQRPADEYSAGPYWELENVLRD